MAEKNLPSSSAPPTLRRNPLAGDFVPVKPPTRLLPVRWTDRVQRYRAKLRSRLFLPYVVAAGVWIVGYNVAVRLWMGPNHPVNNFTYRLWKREGRLNPDLIEKELRLQRATMMEYGIDPYT
uniref:Uncharacterized protein n=1 Tax=Plectus sambesii TaxID=2011161 RepID=A0A914WRF2_9BILA